jgi:poly(3-hydroxybutyrate) depolymerase
LCTGIKASQKRHLTVKGAGHYGIFSGRRWRETVYPQVRDFIRKFDTTQPTASAVSTNVSAISRARKTR